MHVCKQKGGGKHGARKLSEAGRKVQCMQASKVKGGYDACEQRKAGEWSEGYLPKCLDFARGKLAGKVANGNYMTMRCCNQV